MSLSALLERVEGAMAQDQWQVIRDIALALVPDDPSTRVRVNALCDAGREFGHDVAAVWAEAV